MQLLEDVELRTPSLRLTGISYEFLKALDELNKKLVLMCAAGQDVAAGSS